ncbi:hypothetical protein L1281_000650 [Neisseria sp. HSC-16F19]|nr:DUF2788 domain-containing protein [Neisseria sp. HSC-16F19]MCP2040070.1 hypothetical protein [Neisseria sp. HSC-16F19]
MTEAEFSQWSMKILLVGLVIFLGFIIWDLGKKSNAGKFGTAMLFLVLGLGVAGFIFKESLIGLLMSFR